MIILALVSLVLLAQQPPESPIAFDALKTGVSQAGAVAADSVQQLTVDWNAYAGAPGDLVSAATAVPLNRFQLRERRRLTGPLALERNPELAQDRLVLVAADAKGVALSWQLIVDPRIVRAEHPGPDGTLAGQTLYRADVQVTFDLPDLQQLTQVFIYQPRWTGDRWLLDLVASLPVPRQ